MKDRRKVVALLAVFIMSPSISQAQSRDVSVVQRNAAETARKAKEKQQQEEATVREIVRIAGNVCVDLDKARALGIDVNEFVFAAKEFTPPIHTADEATEARHVEQAYANLRRRIAASQKLKGEIARRPKPKNAPVTMSSRCRG